MTDHNGYFEYLQRRTWRGLIYRRRVVYPRLVRHLRGRALDIGCGMGEMLRYRPGTVGVDVNPRTVAWCKEQRLTAYRMQPDVLPFGDASFDSALLDNVLEHLIDPLPLLAEVRRVLAPGGAVVVGVPGRRGYARDPDHKVFYDEPGLIAALAAAHLPVRTIFHTPFRSAWLEARLKQYCVYGVFARE